MKEKLYRKTQFYGILTTITMETFYMVAPFPVPGDDWQLEYQQSWSVVPCDTTELLNFKTDFTKAGEPAYDQPRVIVTSFPTINPELSDGWVWTGEYLDDVVQDEVEEPTKEDVQWAWDNMPYSDKIAEAIN